MMILLYSEATAASWFLSGCTGQVWAGITTRWRWVSITWSEPGNYYSQIFFTLVSIIRECNFSQLKYLRNCWLDKWRNYQGQQPIFVANLSRHDYWTSEKYFSRKYFRNFGRAWSYVQLCQAIPLVCGCLITGIYYSIGNYISVVSIIVSSLTLSMINVHKHNRDKRRRALRRQNTTSEKEEACHESLIGQKTSPVSDSHIPIRSSLSYEVRSVLPRHLICISYHAGLCHSKHASELHLHFTKLTGWDPGLEEAGANLHFWGGCRGHGPAWQHPGGAGVPGQHHQLQQGGELSDVEWVRAEPDQGEGGTHDCSLQKSKKMVSSQTRKLHHPRWGSSLSRVT